MMDVRGWIIRQLSATVESGRGRWLEGVSDCELGEGIFGWLSEPELRLHAFGMTLTGAAGWRVTYGDILDVTFLDLPGLLAASKEREKPVEVSITTRSGTLKMLMHLYDYTGFSSTVPRLLEFARTS